MVQEHKHYSEHSVFVPMVLVVLTLLFLLVFQINQLLSEKETLTQLKTTQENAIAESQRMRSQLDAIATGMAKLAEQGNANAQAVVQQLRRQGISIKPDAAQPSP